MSQQTDETQGDYVTEQETKDALEMLGKGYGDQPAAIIDPPRIVKAVRENGLVEYQVWGWVKTSANFIFHIKKLKGAKLSVWNVIALSIDENGKCNLSIPKISELTGYSVSEVKETIGELDEMGYLSVERRSGKKSIYEPEFAARSSNTPTGTPKPDPARKTTPPVVTGKRANDPASPPIENSTPSVKRVKRVNGAIAPNAIPLDWKLGHGIEITEDDLKLETDRKMMDAASLISTGFGINAIQAHNLSYAFMVSRQIVIPNSKVSGQRKAIREMIEMKVSPANVVQAVKDLTAKEMTIVDLFSIAKTAIALANPAPNQENTTERNPLGI